MTTPTSEFGLRDFASIESEMIAEVIAGSPLLTDFTEGAVLRALLASVAMELQREDFACWQGVRDGIETGTYKNFDFFRLSAVSASGTVRFTRVFADGPYIVPIGTLVSVPGSAARVYETLAAVTFVDGVFTVTVGVRCLTPGTTGNTGAQTIVTVNDVGLATVLTVTNLRALLDGLDQESDAARRDRFRDYIAGLSRGTAIAIQFAARTVELRDVEGLVVERVASALVHEPFLDTPPGLLGRVEVYIDNGSGTASPALVTETFNVLRGYTDTEGLPHRGWVAAGLDLSVRAVTPITVDVVVSITLAPGFATAGVASAVNAACLDYIRGLAVFSAVITAEFVAAAMSVAGVADAVILSPTGNVAVQYDQRAVPGTVTVLVP